jgi:hypothetical protein
MTLMVKKRNYIEEIISRRNRLLRKTDRSDQVNKRLRPVIYSLEELKKLKTKDKSIKTELYKYIPIAGIACVEGWYRMAVAALIDKSAPFRDNVKDFTDIKFETDSVLAIQERKLSFGEFFAHFLPVNRFEDICKGLCTISGEDFLERFKVTRINPIQKPNPVTFTKEAPEIFEGVKKAFRLRHIFCHELATSFRFDVNEIEHCAYGFLFFLIGADRAVQDLLQRRQ